MSESNIIIGDFNIATNLSINHSKYLLNILSSSNLKLHNTYPTHKYGNTLDLLISHKSSNLICSHYVGPCISDHHIIFSTLQSLKPPHATITRSFRKTKIINTPQATKRVARQRKIYNNVPPVYILWVK